MASIHAVPPPASFHDEQGTEPRSHSPPNSTQRPLNATSFDANHLSTSSQFQSSSVSPMLNDTPSESISTFSPYQPSDYSDLDDPFFGIDFSATEPGTPSFLDPLSRTDSFGQPLASRGLNGGQTHNMGLDALSYPLTPEQPASLQINSLGVDARVTIAKSVPDKLPAAISPRELQKPSQPHPVSANAVHPTLQPTPDTSRSGRSSEDGPVPFPTVVAAQSPRVTVSMWGKGNVEPVQSVERTFSPAEDSSKTRGRGTGSAGDLISSQDHTSIMPHARSSSFSRRGLDPENRPLTEVASVNEMTIRREIEEKNQEVDQWLAKHMSNGPSPEASQRETNLQASPESMTAEDGIHLGDRTENVYKDGQTYFTPGGGGMTATDLHIMNSNRVWGDSPMLHPISGPNEERYQPDSSNAAIARFNRMCMDNASIISKAATWGTRRRSLPSLKDVDIENVTSGNILKKLSITRGEGGRRPSILKDLRGLVRTPSALKRARSTREDGGAEVEASPPPEKRDSLPQLLQARSGSWGSKKTQTPSINTALVSMGSTVASIGATHTRNGSVGAAPVTSPKSPFGSLQVKNTLRRPRSKSDLPNGSTSETHSNLVGMWRKTGGPPVAALAKTTSTNTELDDDEDDEEDLGEDGEMNSESSKLIEDVAPDLHGFQQHVLRLNPELTNRNNYLVNRIAHQQVVRYKLLLNNRVKHLGAGAACHSGALCQARGGRPVLLDQKGDVRELDPLSSGLDSLAGDTTPIEGSITKDSFPQDIPMPPTHSLPAEFECQLCFTLKKPKKPSDWTKHVHEDVQPFTCTWDQCRDHKIFKRKADWVRHENERHRHLEWWTCDVEDCLHTCYRRDNFLQHLVREHKFPEPKMKTKAAIKRAGTTDSTWQRVEQCRHETETRPQDEPCRFCGKQFPSWKKLTVHLAKHMEHICLPILRLVAAKELDPDTIISPVQDPPPRSPFGALDPSYNEATAVKNEPAHGSDFAQRSYQHPTVLHNNNDMFQSMGQLSFQASNTGNPQYTEYMYDSQYSNNGQPMGQNMMGLQNFNGGTRGFNQQYHNTNNNNNNNNNMMAVSGAASYMGTSQPYMSIAPDTEPFPALDHNALGLLHPAQIGAQMVYDELTGPNNINDNQYTSQGSISPYSRSPLQGTSGYYPPQ